MNTEFGKFGKLRKISKFCMFIQFGSLVSEAIMTIYFLLELARNRWMRRRYVETMLKRIGLSKRRAVLIASRWVY